MHPKFMSLVDVTDKADACKTDDDCSTNEKYKNCEVTTGTCYDKSATANAECVTMKADGMTLSVGGECLPDCK
jgi:hypothetical protein